MNGRIVIVGFRIILSVVNVNRNSAIGEVGNRGSLFFLTYK